MRHRIGPCIRAETPVCIRSKGDQTKMLRNHSIIRAALIFVCTTLLIGCWSKETKEKAPAKAEVVALKAPLTAMVYGGTGSISNVLGKIEKLGKTVMPNLPPLASMVGPLVQAEFRLTNNTALNMGAPLRFALFDPKVFGRDPSALLMGVTSAEAFVQSLPGVEKKQNDAGNAWSFKRFAGARNGVYVNFIGQHVVLTGHPKLFSTHKAFFEGLLKEKLSADGVVFVEMDHVMKGFAQEIDALTKDTEAAKALLAQQGQNPAYVDTIAPWVLRLRKSMGDIRQLQGRLVFDTDAFKLDGRFVLRDGSEMAKTLSEMKGTNHAFLKQMPVDAPMVVSVDARTDAYAGIIKQLMGDVLKAVAPADQKAEVDNIVKAIADYLEGIDGKLAFAVHGDPLGSGLTSSMLIGIKDRQKVSQSQKVLSQLSGKLQAWQMAGGLPGVPVPETVYEEKAYSLGGYDVAISKTGGSDPMLAAGPLAELGTSHFALGDKMAIGSQGSSAKQVITNHVESKYKGLASSPIIKRAFKSGANDTFALFTISPIAIAKRVSLGGMNPLAMSLGNVPDDGSLTISMGKNEGAVQLVVDLPVKLIDQGLKAFEKVKGGL